MRQQALKGSATNFLAKPEFGGFRDSRKALDRLATLASSIAVTCMLLATPTAVATEFSFGKISGSFDVTGTYTLVSRLQDFDEDAINPNNDDGDRNFRDAGIVSNIFRGTYDLGARRNFKNSSFGFFTRGLYFIDTKIRNAGNDNDSPITNNANAIYGGPLSGSDLRRFTEDTQDEAGSRGRILDVFAYANLFNNTNHPVNIRVGQQVVNWGESLFIQSSITNAINYANASLANTPGTEVREILLPVNQVFASVGITPDLSLQGYYQFEWEKTIAPPNGTYLSQNDFVGEGGESIIIAPGGPHLQRDSDIRPDDGGQFGAALRWFAPQGLTVIGGTDFGFYYLNYHSKLPQITIEGVPRPGPGMPAPVGPGNYLVTYFEDVKLYGLSFNTAVPGGVAVSGEVTYRDDAPIQTVQLAPPVFGASAAQGGAQVSLATPEELITAQLTLNKNFTTTIIGALADGVGGLFEVGIANTPNLNSDEVFRGPNPADSTAWGYRGRLTLTYFDGIGRFLTPLSGTDLIVAFNLAHDVKGVSVIPAGSFTDNEKSYGLTLTGSFQNTIEASFGFAFFNSSALEDRDFVSFTLKYRL